jgi:glycosyltransferase involved in cell wall biosynthesis
VRLLFVADGRSPIALNWIRYFVQRGDEVFLASTFACKPTLPLSGLEIVPVAYSGARSSTRATAGAFARGRRLLAAIRRVLGPLTVRRASTRLRQYQERVQPELVHAMRIPFEGMLAADAYSRTPLVVSVWGNDLTLQAPANRLMRHYTSWALQIADALHADCRRDIRLGRQWGFDSARPTLVIPGNGGIQQGLFHPGSTPPDAPVVLNPRGARAYVRNDVFFQAIPFVLERFPAARFKCAALAGDHEASYWIDRLGIRAAVVLLPELPPEQMADLYRSAQVIVSPSLHDGTPNSLLEGMACGCLPIAGDLESIREWIEPGRNGLLVDPTDPRSLAASIVDGLENKSLRAEAAGINLQIIAQRAGYEECMAQAAAFYSRVLTRV